MEKKLVSTGANDTTKNDDVAESKATNSNTKEDDEFFDTSMNETSKLEVTTTRNDTKQNKSTTNELEDNSNNGTNKSDSESMIDTDDMNAGTSTLFCDGATANDSFPSIILGNLDKTILKKLGMKRKILETNNFMFFY